VSPPPTHSEIAAHLEEIVASGEFAGSERRRTLLRFLVEETLAGRGEALKAYTIGRKALLRGEGFDPQADPIVRVEIGRLRATLDRYYHAHRDVELVISIPRGRYRAEVRRNTERAAAEGGSQGDTRVVIGPFSSSGDDAEELAAMFADEVTALCRRAGTGYRFTAAPATTTEWGDGFRLTGSLRHRGNRVRVNAELLRPSPSETIWSRTIEVCTDELHSFAVVDELAHLLAWALADDFGVLPRLARRDRRVPAPGRPTVPASYLEAFEAVRPDAQRASRDDLETVAASTPDDPRALAALSDSLFTSWWLHLDPPGGALARAEDLAARAVATAPELAEAHLALAYTHYAQRRSRLMLLELDRAEELSGGSPHAQVSAGLLICLDGDTTEGMRRTRRAVELNPDLPAWWRVVPAVAAIDREDFEEALTEAIQIGDTAGFVGPLLRLVARSTLGHPGSEADAKALLELDDDAAAHLPAMVERVFHDDRIAELLVDAALASGMLPGNAV
jgi:hypothetical protein